MTDFLTRLAERTLGVANVAQPLIALRFAPGPPLPGEDAAQALTEGEEARASPSSELELESPVPTGRRLSPGPETLQGGDVVLRRSAPEEMSLEGRSHRPGESPVLPVSAGHMGALGTQLPGGSALPRTHTPEGDMAQAAPASAERRVAQAAFPPHPTALCGLHELAPIDQGDRWTDAGHSGMPVLVPQPARQAGMPRAPDALQAEVAAVPRLGGLSQSAMPPLPEPSPPTIHVTIGRVEVRAVMPPASPPPHPAPARRTAALSLDDYLAQRDGGQR